MMIICDSSSGGGGGGGVLRFGSDGGVYFSDEMGENI